MIRRVGIAFNLRRGLKALAAKDINATLRKIDFDVIQMGSQKQTFEEKYVRKLLQKFLEDLNTIHDDQHKRYTITPRFQVVIALSICHEAYHALMVQHWAYEEQHGTLAKLEAFKKTCMNQFFNEYNDSSSEIKAADLVVSALEPVIRTSAVREIPAEIAREIKHNIATKHHLIEMMCSDLADRGDFDGFMRYVQDAAHYAKEYISNTIERDWLASQNGPSRYIQTALEKVATKCGGIKTALSGISMQSEESITQMNIYALRK